MKQDPDVERIALADGRMLAYRTYGEHRSGDVVVNCHGGLMDGRDVSLADAAARALGLRVLSPDRPGVGSSSPRPGRTILDWAGDVEQLVDRLGIPRFRAMGWSEGGQYALALAHRLADRVDGVAVIAGALPLDDSTRFGELNAVDRRLATLAAHRPTLARLYLGTTHAFARLSPGATAGVSARALDPSDAAVVRANRRWFARSLEGALANRPGAIEEYRAFVKPWGFAPEDIRIPAHVYQGGADRLIPASWGEELASRLPVANLHRYPDEGHFIAVTRRDEVLADLYITAPR
ncbi:alpha/beta hydrolase [Microbacterium sp. X-17]|uniref:alpha/beta fold hydrolase n=1 Tax=Microbacterium sp. X-17 TaxID=3144404 RepID=UPI0031F4A3CC